MPAPQPTRSAAPGNPTFGPPLSPSSQADLDELRRYIRAAPGNRVILIAGLSTVLTAVSATIATIVAISLYW